MHKKRLILPLTIFMMILFFMVIGIFSSDYFGLLTFRKAENRDKGQSLTDRKNAIPDKRPYEGEVSNKKGKQGGYPSSYHGTRNAPSDRHISKDAQRHFSKSNNGTLTRPASRSAPSLMKAKLSDIAYYDEVRGGFVLKESDLYTEKDETSELLLSALKVLNKKDVPPDYYQWEEYKSAFHDIDLFYPDLFIWPYFTNMEAKANFFLFLFERYAEDNKKWRRYEKDVSDCSQFAQRIYLFLCPDEIVLEDEDYFVFLFTNEANRVERKKLCNKIPSIYYTIVTPYTLKRDQTDPLPPTSHAMISFAPEGNLKKLIVGEPQSGDFAPIDSLWDLFVKKDPYSPLILDLEKVITITSAENHEARTTNTGSYFIPQLLSAKAGSARSEIWNVYEKEPIFLNTEERKQLRIVSQYFEGILNARSLDRQGFINSLEGMLRYTGTFPSPAVDSLRTAVDVVMHSLITLDSAGLQKILEETHGLMAIAGRQKELSPQTTRYIQEIDYLFRLKLKGVL